jgi:hypothetical protein
LRIEWMRSGTSDDGGLRNPDPNRDLYLPRQRFHPGDAVKQISVIGRMEVEYAPDLDGSLS